MKTLKEIYGNKANGQISIKELRQEAIKWIKNIEIEDTSGDGYFEFVWINGEMVSNLSDWIKRFFNITEEDLKVSE